MGIREAEEHFLDLMEHAYKQASELSAKRSQSVSQMEPTVAERMAALIEEHKDKIPSWAQWIAADYSGIVFVYERKPDMLRSGFATTGNLMSLGNHKGLCENWRETLTELKPDAISQYYNDRRGIKTDKPDESCWDQEMMIQRDKGIRSKAENEYLSRTALEFFTKELSVKPLTIPSTLPSEQAMPMMLGGEFGAQVYE